MDIFSGLLYAKCLTENMIWTVSYILKSSVSTQFSNTKINKQKKKSMLTMTVIYKKTDENNKSSTVKIKTL